MVILFTYSRTYLVSYVKQQTPSADGQCTVRGPHTVTYLECAKGTYGDWGPEVPLWGPGTKPR